MNYFDQPNLYRVRLTSDKWQAIFPLPFVLDPDGWDRQNFTYSWFKEEISLEEYKKRLAPSTCQLR